MDTADKNTEDLWRANERMSAPRKIQIFVWYFFTRRVHAYPTGSVLINTLALYPPRGWMVETKDSAALFLPSTEALSHGRSARRIGRVRSHKRSLRNQFHLFVNTREDFHSPGRNFASRPRRRARPRSVSLLLDGNSDRHCRSPESSAPLRIANTVLALLALLSFSPFVSLHSFLLKNNRRRTRTSSERRRARRRLSEVSKTSSCKLTRNAYRKSAGLFSHRARLRRSEHVVIPPVARKDIISFSALWTLCFADYSRLHRFTLGDSFSRKDLFCSLSH